MNSLNADPVAAVAVEFVVCSYVVSRPDDAPPADQTLRYVIGSYDVELCIVSKDPVTLATDHCLSTWRENESRFTTIAPYFACACECIQTTQRCYLDRSSISG